VRPSNHRGPRRTGTEAGRRERCRPGSGASPRLIAAEGTPHSTPDPPLPHRRGARARPGSTHPAPYRRREPKETLLAASLPTCRTLFAITSDDATNLETALIGRAIRKDLPVVLRLFDGDSADRIQRAFSITASRSVSHLAAPTFAAHMLGQVLDTVPVGRHVLVVADLAVGAYSTLEGQTVGDVRRLREAGFLR